MTDLSGEYQPVDGGSRIQKQGDATFLTGLTNPGLQSMKTKPPRSKAKEYTEDEERGVSALTGGPTDDAEDAVSAQFENSDIDLNISYSDSDKEVPFRQAKEVIEYLFNLEETNLFKINLI